MTLGLAVSLGLGGLQTSNTHAHPPLSAAPTTTVVPEMEQPAKTGWRPPTSSQPLSNLGSVPDSSDILRQPSQALVSAPFPTAEGEEDYP